MTSVFLAYAVYPRSISATARKLHVAGRVPDAPRTALQIVEEATRAHWAVPHVDQPQAPLLLWGQDPMDALAEAERRAAAARLPDKRRLRKDSPILLAGVVSWPSKELNDAYLAFERDSVAWLRQRWAGSLAYVLRHEDEENLHLHFGAVPPLVDRRFDISSIDPAREYAALVPARKSEKRKAFRVAKRKVLDDFFESVGIHHGLARKGAGHSRKRYPRDVAVAIREGEKRVAMAYRRQEQMLAAAREELGPDADLCLHLADTKLERDDLRKRLEETEAAMQKLKAQASRIAARALQLSHEKARRKQRKEIAQPQRRFSPQRQQALELIRSLQR